MKIDASCIKSCTPLQKRSILKIAIELVKADNRIHRKEISVLDQLQESLGLTQEELDMVHYASLSDAVSIVRRMEETKVEFVMDVFNSIMRIDSDVDFEENLLFAAVTISCNPASRQWATVLSLPELQFVIPDKQIAFLEKDYTSNAHQVLDDKYDNLLISKTLGDIGLSLFYLPDVRNDLGLAGDGPESKFGLLKNSISYLMPAGDRIKVERLKDSLSDFNSQTFFKVICSKLGQTPDNFPFGAFLFVKIRESVILDDENNLRNNADCLCIDISSDVKYRILSFASLFGDSTQLLPYDGYYKLLYDYFSSESKINSEILLDREYHFTLPSLDGRRIPFESSPQARTLYLLLLKQGRGGISQNTFDSAVRYLESIQKERFISGGSFNLDQFESELLSSHESWRSIILTTIRLYRALSTKDDENPGFLSYIISILSHRSSLKTYLNKGFRSIRELSDKELYLVSFDTETNAYRVGIGLSMFLIDEDGKTVHLSESQFWKALS